MTNGKIPAPIGCDAALVGIGEEAEVRVTALALASIFGAVCCGTTQQTASSDRVAPVPAATHSALPPAAPPSAAAAPQPTPTRATPPASARWYCYRVWDATNPDNDTSGCLRDEDECGRQRWQLARTMRNQYGMSIETKACAPYASVACFTYRLSDGEREQTSCHPSADECEKMRSGNASSSSIADLSRCEEQR